MRLFVFWRPGVQFYRFHLYLILDLYSRKIVGWEVHDRDNAEQAAHLSASIVFRLCLLTNRALRTDGDNLNHGNAIHTLAGSRRQSGDGLLRCRDVRERVGG